MSTTRSDEIYWEIAHFIKWLDLSLEDFDSMIEDLEYNRKNLTISEKDRIGKKDDVYDFMNEMRYEQTEEPSVAEFESE